MESFAPYVVVEDTGSRLHLKERGWKQKVYFFLFRILPFFLVLQLVLLISVTSGKDTTPQNMSVLLALLVVLPAVILLGRSYVTEIDIDKFSINLVKHTLSGTKHLSYLVSDVENIICKKRMGRDGGVFYYLNFKIPMKRQYFIAIDRQQMNESKRAFISQKLKSLTGLEVVNDDYPTKLISKRK